jgi:hypothetical protein
MNRVELVKTMNDIVNNYVEHYKTDFLYDVDFMYTTNDKKYVWIVRKCGTNIVRLFPADNDSETIKNARLVLDCYKETAEKTTTEYHYYIVDIVNNEIKKLSSKGIKELAD